MGHRQIADQEGHRWDVEDVGPGGGERGEAEGGGEVEHRVRFTRDDGTERVRAGGKGVDELTDAQLRALLAGVDPSRVPPGPDTEANRSRGYGGATD